MLPVPTFGMAELLYDYNIYYCYIYILFFIYLSILIFPMVLWFCSNQYLNYKLEWCIAMLKVCELWYNLYLLSYDIFIFSPGLKMFFRALILLLNWCIDSVWRCVFVEIRIFINQFLFFIKITFCLNPLWHRVLN